MKEAFRRSRLYSFGKEQLLEMLSADRDRWFQCLLTEPLPGDAVITAVAFDFSFDSFRVRITSRAFDAIPEGLPYPDYGPITINVRVARAYDPEPVRAAG